MEESELLTKAFEIHLLPVFDKDVSPQELEGLPLVVDGEIIGYYRNVHKVQTFVASLEPVSTIPENLIEHLKVRGKMIVWMHWPFPEVSWPRERSP